MPSKPGETSLIIDAFHAIDPAAELRAWWDVTLDDEARAALELAAAAIGYLGRSESVCSMRVLDAPDRDERDAVPATEIADDGSWEGASLIELLSLAKEAEHPLASLGVSVSELRRKRMLTPPGTCNVTYAVRRPREVTESLQASEHPPPTIAHLRAVGGNRPSMSDAVTVGHLLRSALQRRFDADDSGRRSAVLSGHDGDGPRRDQHAHAHYLALPGSDDGRIEHLVVWAPEGLASAEVAAIASLRELRMREAPESFHVALVALGRADELLLPRLLGPARTWESLSPMALTRHAKRRGGRIVDSAEEQVLRELALRGIPAPAKVQLVPGAWMRFTSTRPGGSRRTAPRVIGVRLEFAEAITGPIALGGLSHFGLGVFKPAR